MYDDVEETEEKFELTPYGEAILALYHAMDRDTTYDSGPWAVSDMLGESC